MDDIYNKININELVNFMNLMTTKVNATVALRKINELKNQTKAWNGSSKDNLNNSLTTLYDKYVEIRKILEIYNTTIIPSIKEYQEITKEIQKMENEEKSLQEKINAATEISENNSYENKFEIIERNLSDKKIEQEQLRNKLNKLIYNN